MALLPANHGMPREWGLHKTREGPILATDRRSMFMKVETAALDRFLSTRGAAEMVADRTAVGPI